MFYYLYIDTDFLDLDLKNKGLYHNQINNKCILIQDKDLK